RARRTPCEPGQARGLRRGAARVPGQGVREAAAPDHDRSAAHSLPHRAGSHVPSRRSRAPRPPPARLAPALSPELKSMRTRICDLLGIEHPIVGFTPSPEVVAAIGHAGGLGVLGAVRYGNVEELEAALAYLDDQRVPYGVDVVMPAKEMEGLDPASLEAHID